MGCEGEFCAMCFTLGIAAGWAAMLAMTMFVWLLAVTSPNNAIKEDD